MGIWDYVCSLTDSLKRYASGLYSTSYAHGLSATNNIANAVKAKLSATTNIANAVKANADRYLPDKEAQHKMAQFATCLAKNAASESIKLVPGGELARKIVTMSYEDVYKSKNDNDQVQVENKKALDGMQGRGRSRKLSSEEVGENKASEDDEEYVKSQTAPNLHLRPKM